MVSTTTFFKQHGVNLSPEEDLHEAFSRLSVNKNWKPRTIKKKREQFDETICAADECVTPVHDEVPKIVAGSDTDLSVLQNLCAAFGLPEGQSKTQCKKHLRTIHVNIRDVQEGVYKTFPSYSALRKDLARRRISKNEAKALKMTVFLVFLR